MLSSISEKSVNYFISISCSQHVHIMPYMIGFLISDKIRMRTLIVVILASIVLYACSNAQQLKPNRTAELYFDHLAQTPATSEQNVEEVFNLIYSDYKQGANEANIRAVYADELYFNDTFKIIDNIDQLVEYMSHSAGQVNSTTVDILDVIKSEHDYFIRWSMKIDTTISGKDIFSHSIGMTQLRFNDSGKVVFHQDFWDSSEAFFEHLPMMGRFVKKVKTML